LPSFARNQNPPQLYPENAEIATLGTDWFILQTCSRWEKALAWDLRSKNIHYYLPMQWLQTESRGRRNVSLKPYFVGYVFAALQPGEFVDFRESDYVSNVIHVPSPEQMIPELEDLRCGLGDGTIKHPDEIEGGYCQVISGNLTGVYGLAMPTKERFRFKFIYSVLGQKASQIVESAQLRAVG
jgi:hypothetical protein